MGERPAADRPCSSVRMVVMCEKLVWAAVPGGRTKGQEEAGAVTEAPQMDAEAKRWRRAGAELDDGVLLFL